VFNGNSCRIVDRVNRVDHNSGYIISWDVNDSIIKDSMLPGDYMRYPIPNNPIPDWMSDEIKTTQSIFE
jgi:hypothetical protein